MSDLELSVDDLLHLPQAKLDDLFRGAAAGPIPTGEGRGTLIVAPGTQLSETAAKLVHLIAWQGKVFDPVRGELRNEVGPLGTQSVRARVYHDASWFDGQQAIIIDYSRTSLVAHWIRDELRQVAAGVYLGIGYWAKAKILNFALQFPTSGG
jgi:hypothetical protein